MHGSDWQLIVIGLFPILVGLVTLSGIWLPKMRMRYKNTREPLGTLPSTSAALFASSFGLELIWKGFHPASQDRIDIWFIVLLISSAVGFVCGCVMDSRNNRSK
jgi:hypothetical protein